MRLHRIRLRDVKGVQDRTVELPDHGVVVVEGPNEVGKSTLLQAFDRLLELKSTSTSKEVRRLQPVGRDVGPFVEAEFTVAGHRLRLAKQWLRSPMTELTVLEPHPEHHTGAAAQARLDELLDGALDRTLWDALRFTQTGDGSVVPLVDSAVLREALDGAADTGQHAGDGEKVLDAVEREYLLYFTARTGRPAGEYRAAMTAWTAAQDGVAEAQRRVQEARGLLERQHRAREDREGALRDLDRASAGRRSAERAEAGVAVLLTALQHAGTALEEARARWVAAGQARSARTQVAAQLSGLEAELVTLSEQVRAEQARATSLTEQVAAADEAAARAETAAESAEEALQRARADADHLGDVSRLARLREQHRTVDEAVTALVQARADAPTDPLTPAALRELEQQSHTLDLLRARHESASPRVRVESLGATVTLRPTVSRADQEGPAAPATDTLGARTAEPGARTVDPGGSTRVVLVEDLEVVVPGAVRVVLELEQEAQERRHQVDAATTGLAAALARAGATGLDQARDRVQADAAATARVRERERDVQVALSGAGRAVLAEALAGQVPVVLGEEVGRLQALVADYLAHRGRAGRPALPEDEGTARSLLQAASEAAHRARDQRRAATAAAQEQRRAWATAGADLHRLTGHLEAGRDRAAQLTAALARARAEDGSDELLDQRLSVLGEEVAGLETAQRRARAEVLAADAEAVARHGDEARALERAAQTGVEQASAILHALTGQVELAASEGRQELLDLSLSGLEAAEQQLAALDRRARAARHLRASLHDHRDAAHRAYVRPFTRALEELGREVYGPSFGVTVGPDLTVQARTLEGVTIPFADLSGGAKEQLGILARLAVAHLVDPARGVPVVIDDALGYSDPERLAQMGQVLADSSGERGQVQVILLTCTPQRYASVRHAHTVRLTA